MKWSLFTSFIFLFVFISGAVAQDTTECSTTNIEACRVDLTLYCQRQGAVPFSFSLDPNNCDGDGCPLNFVAEFPEEFEQTRLPIIFVDGEIETGNVNEVRIGALQCNGQTCSDAVPIDKLQELQTEFDFDQAVINVVLRRRTNFGKDFCIGKFTNNPDLIAERDSSARAICTLNPTAGNESATGTGFFTPGGYGNDGAASFHLSVEGLPTDTNYKGCSVIGEDRYRRVLAFQPVLLSTASDEAIYGELSPREQEVFDANRFLFSYDLRRTVSESTGSSSRNLLFTPSLSLINKSVSSSTGANTVRDTNKATLKKRRRKRRRKQKKQSSRSVSLRSASVEVRASETVEQEVISWLSFDPLANFDDAGGTLVISSSCVKNVLENSIGTLVCGNDAEDDFRRCRQFSFGSTGLSASVCREVKDEVGQLTFRAKNSSETALTICVNGSPLGTQLNIVQGTDADSPSFPSAELKFTENEALLSGDSSFVALGSNVEDVSTVALSSSGNCSDTLSSVSF